ncbi:DUF3291 domain-containing protein [Actinophytocola xanthii]|uniref:DUF3291 domain-containing protein n=1 Tax=Actinophytocola xanthii TaxID=1912961 RepID=A0A1Q8CRQ3_9PSEU|nr:DUF3291 domain-containing protein [Actinophytocola xanthii]OLF17038.1 hypothetical protein BU204_13115 [Actinophytocola xanthii]
MENAVQLAQVNIARLRHPLDDPRLAEFTAAMAAVNALAERSPGFVWRHTADGGHLSAGELLGDPLVVINLSVWADYPYLHEFAYRSQHAHFLRRQARWFAPIARPTTALWWLPAGSRPTPEHALARLTHLRRYGPGPRAFTTRHRFTADGVPVPRRRSPREEVPHAAGPGQNVRQ